jgi:putative transposase
MRKTRFSETKIVSILKQQESGVPTADICRDLGISKATFYNWKAKYGGLEVKEVKRLKELEAENSKLKRMFAEVSMENYALKDVLEKKF